MLNPPLAQLSPSLSRLPDWSEEEAPHPERYGKIELLCTRGDVKKRWDRNNPDEVADARRSYIELKAKGYAAWKSDAKTGDKAGPMPAFDPDAESLILVPPLQGGAPLPSLTR